MVGNPRFLGNEAYHRIGWGGTGSWGGARRGGAKVGKPKGGGHHRWKSERRLGLVGKGETGQHNKPGSFFPSPITLIRRQEGIPTHTCSQ